MIAGLAFDCTQTAAATSVTTKLIRTMSLVGARSLHSMTGVDGGLQKVSTIDDGTTERVAAAVQSRARCTLRWESQPIRGREG
jgi:hypothetical protein